jgi:flagellar biosynthesis protein FliQ
MKYSINNIKEIKNIIIIKIMIDLEKWVMDKMYYFHKKIFNNKKNIISN